MSREIKFRVWDGTEMMPLDELSLDLEEMGYIDHLHIGDVLRDIAEKMKLMQYTGLKDKNGAEIYEGDIVSIENDWVVEWDKRIAGFVLVGGQVLDSLNIAQGSQGRVMGNIYENPELMK